MSDINELKGTKTEPIYLDHNATTPVDRRVLEKMLPYFCEVYGNAASIDHLHGNRAKQAVDEARQAIAKVLGHIGVVSQLHTDLYKLNKP